MLARGYLDRALRDELLQEVHRRRILAIKTPSATELLSGAGLPPDPWQSAVLEAPEKLLLLNCARQVGKSTVLAALALQQAAVKPHSLVLCVAPALRQSAELLRKIADLYHESAAELPALKLQSALHLEFVHGGRVAVVPANESRGVRGYSAPDLVLFDEASRIPDEVYHAARPMLAVGHGRIVMASTPSGRRGEFFRQWDSGEGFRRWHVTADDCPRITTAFLDAERLTLGDRLFAQEYSGDFSAATGSVFDMHAFDSALVDGSSNLFDAVIFGRGR